MTTEDDEQDRHNRTPEERLGMLERDTRQLARMVTGIVDAGKTFSSAQLEQLRTVMREELADAGLRIDGPEHVDDARRDFMFLRSLRKGVNGTASKIGWTVIAAILAAAIWLFSNGLNFWRGHT